LYEEQLDLASPRQWNDQVPKDILAEVACAHGPVTSHTGACGGP
jgi:hypothetical protein